MVSVMWVSAYVSLNKNSMKMMIHRLHRNMVSIPCIRMCFFKSDCLVHENLHTSEEYGFICRVYSHVYF